MKEKIEDFRFTISMNNKKKKTNGNSRNVKSNMRNKNLTEQYDSREDVQNSHQISVLKIVKYKMDKLKHNWKKAEKKLAEAQ